ncbi:hypothetical protein BC939DRAFT_469434 [Gamsiella multidivaricata]|uniref:uncharacterized protein n=1 Tax=Gamsiella multidivaricata TaxID=101098 RepID=UPI002220712A|nr:uncharacterized protein BC939DRAFT_469434 [Gamsiella multidivaricata]KAI7816360.1 hypothetical protein BC939DRAFT_469434 [Gamsiella multidivaricata]
MSSSEVFPKTDSKTLLPSPRSTSQKQLSSPPTPSEDANIASSSPSSRTSIRIVLLLTLVLFICGYSILTSSESPIDQLVRFFKPILDTTSTDSSSFSVTPTSTHSSTDPPPFGAPLSDLFPPTSPTYGRQKQQDHQREQTAEQQRRRREKRQHSQFPFGDFFGTHDEDDENGGQDDLNQTGTNSEGCAGYYCADTDVCVDQPIHCPCPYETDTKCFRGDWYVCHRGWHAC